MKKYFTTGIGLLRLIGFVEGLSLLILVFIGVPMKYFMGNPSVVKSVGPVHGVLFILFVFFIIKMAMEKNWNFGTVTWKLLAGSVIPFGTFYVDSKILGPMQDEEQE